jgi:hypothetical protein
MEATQLEGDTAVYKLCIQFQSIDPAWYADNSTASQQFITVVADTAGKGVSDGAEAQDSKSVPDPGPDGLQTMVVPTLLPKAAEVASSTN